MREIANGCIICLNVYFCYKLITLLIYRLRSCWNVIFASALKTDANALFINTDSNSINVADPTLFCLNTYRLTNDWEYALENQVGV